VTLALPRRDEGCTSRQPECLAAAKGGAPELDDAKLDRVTFYSRTIAVPARRAPQSVDAGARLFGNLGCSGCHATTLTTGSSDIEALSQQVIHPYSDLLLHDMGADLADGRPDFAASGSEWRTAPLWGLGLIETVNGHTRLLHDGRARSIEEAILWHGGEAAAAQRAFRSLSVKERADLVALLESL
jgi:CxxC motif-containing protein (DUF1111 family)